MTWPYPLRSLANRNLRLFFAGQSISVIGTWMQTVALGWLVYRLTHSTQLLGLLGFLGQVPAFLFGIWAGSLADRFSRRKMVLATQINATAQAALLAVLTLTDVVQVWHLLALASMLGMSTAFEIPARQALFGEIAGEDLSAAVALNSSIYNGARILGPAVAGYLVAAIGEGWCFAVNALSFAGTIYAVWVMRVVDRPLKTRQSGPAHMFRGLTYAVRTPYARALLMLVTASSFFAMPYATFLPVFAADVLHGDARLLGALQASSGVGALVAAIGLLMRRGLRGLGRRVGVGASSLGAGVAVLSLSKNPVLSCVGLVMVGFGFVTQAAGTITLLQELSPNELRGRIMGLYSTLFIGMTPFGSLAAGLVADRFDAPRTLFAGALVVLLSSALFHAAVPGLRRTVVAQHPALFPSTPP
jgi:MFS family permease